MSKIIGIDLGTTNSCLAVMEGGTAKVIPAADTGRNVTPSVVEPVKNLVGDVAKRQIISQFLRTLYIAVKRLMDVKYLIRSKADSNHGSLPDCSWKRQYGYGGGSR